MTLEQVKETSFCKLQELLGEPRGQMLIEGVFASNETRNVFLEQIGEPLIEGVWKSDMADSVIVKKIADDAEYFLHCICSPLITE